MRVCVHIYKWGCLKKGVPHNIYIYIHIHTHIFIYVCVCIFKFWKIGIILIWESASSTARNSLAVFTAKTRGTWRKQVVYFSYIIDIKIQQGLVFFAGRTHGWEALRDHTPKTNAEVIQYIQKSYTLKGLVKIPQVGPIKAWN